MSQDQGQEREPRVVVNYRPPIVAVDFDGTVVEHAYPSIGAPVPEAIRVLKRLSDAGCRLMLWTCRENEGDDRRFLSDAADYLRNAGIKIRSVNENHPEDDFRPADSPRRKPYADLYIDDRNYPPVPITTLWVGVERLAEARGWIESLDQEQEQEQWQHVLSNPLENPLQCLDALCACVLPVKPWFEVSEPFQNALLEVVSADDDQWAGGNKLDPQKVGTWMTHGYVPVGLYRGVPVFASLVEDLAHGAENQPVHVRFMFNDYADSGEDSSDDDE